MEGMNTRSELYRDIAARLADVEEIRHIDLWNRNVEFLEQERPWPTPAVFVEFGEIDWKAAKTSGGVCLRGTGTLLIHIVTEWDDTDGTDYGCGCGCGCHGIDRLGLSDIVQERVEGMSGEGYDGVSLSRTLTNHDHEDIVENIDTYGVRYLKRVPHSRE